MVNSEKVMGYLYLSSHFLFPDNVEESSNGLHPHYYPAFSGICRHFPRFVTFICRCLYCYDYCVIGVTNVAL